MTFTYVVIINISKYPLKAHTFPLHQSLSNNSVHSADVWYIAWISLLSTNFSLFIECNKQTNKQTLTFPLHRPLSNNSVPLLMSDIWYDFCYYYYVLYYILYYTILLERPRLDGRIISRWIFRKWEVVVGTGWSWLRIGTGGGHLWVRWWTFGFQKCGEFLD